MKQENTIPEFICKIKMTNLLKHFGNSVTISNEEHQLVFWKLQRSGIPPRFCVEFNSQILKDPKTIETALKFFNSMVEKYSLQEALQELLQQYKLEITK